MSSGAGFLSETWFGRFSLAVIRVRFFAAVGFLAACFFEASKGERDYSKAQAKQSLIQCTFITEWHPTPWPHCVGLSKPQSSQRSKGGFTHGYVRRRWDPEVGLRGCAPQLSSHLIPITYKVEKGKSASSSHGHLISENKTNPRCTIHLTIITPHVHSEH